MTLDKTRMGMDNGMATEPEEFKKLISECREIQIAMGGRERVLLQEELEQRNNMRRSIIASVDICKGHVLAEQDLDAKRPGTGISPDKIGELIGKKAVRDIEADTLISYDDVE